MSYQESLIEQLKSHSTFSALISPATELNADKPSVTVSAFDADHCYFGSSTASERPATSVPDDQLDKLEENAVESIQVESSDSHLSPEAALKSFGTRELFVNRYKRLWPASHDSSDCNVVVDEEAESLEPTYHTDRDMHSESESMMVAASIYRLLHMGAMSARDMSSDAEGCVWSDQIDKTHWSARQTSVFYDCVDILNRMRVAELANVMTPNGAMIKRSHLETSARQLRIVLGRHAWDERVFKWLHRLFLDKLPLPLLATYLDILQTLRPAVPALLDPLLYMPDNKAVQGEVLHFVHKGPWDPLVYSSIQPKEISVGDCQLLLIPPLPQIVSEPGLLSHERYAQFYRNQMSEFDNCTQINFTLPDRCISVSQCADKMLEELRDRLNYLTKTDIHSRIVLVGWDTSALLACKLALDFPFTAVIALAFPNTTYDGLRGDVDDALLDIVCPVLFVVGQFASACALNELQDMRLRMTATTGLVVVGAADDQLRVDDDMLSMMGMHQGAVDRCVLEAIAEFIQLAYQLPVQQLPAQHKPLDEQGTPKFTADTRKRKDERDVQAQFSSDSSAVSLKQGVLDDAKRHKLSSPATPLPPGVSIVKGKPKLFSGSSQAVPLPPSFSSDSSSPEKSAATSVSHEENGSRSPSIIEEDSSGTEDESREVVDLPSLGATRTRQIRRPKNFDL